MFSFDHELQEEQRLVRDTTQSFAQKQVSPLAAELDAEHRFPDELVSPLAELGFWGIFVDPEYSGSGLDHLSYCLIVEELSRACASTGVIISAHNSLCVWPIMHFGTDAQKKEFLPELATGKAIGCFALSEPGTGSDAARLTCKFEKVDDGWRINGVKNWITNAPVSRYCVLIAMGDPSEGHKSVTAFIIDLENDEGVSVGKKEEKLGICASPTASISFSDCVIPENRILGKEGEGFKIAMKTLDGGRLGIASQANGITSACLEESVSYAKERETFGKPISEHQSIQNYIADISLGLDASRALTYSAARRKSQGLPYTRQAAQAKLLASETAVAASLKCIQIHGGYGYVREFSAERHLRDAKITEIYEGTSEIQRLVIAAQTIHKEGR